MYFPRFVPRFGIKMVRLGNRIEYNPIWPQLIWISDIGPAWWTHHSIGNGLAPSYHIIFFRLCTLLVLLGCVEQNLIILQSFGIVSLNALLFPRATRLPFGFPIMLSVWPTTFIDIRIEQLLRFSICCTGWTGCNELARKRLLWPLTAGSAVRWRELGCC